MTKPAPRLRVRPRPTPPKPTSGKRNWVLAALILVGGSLASVAGYHFGQNALADVTAPHSPVTDKRKLLGKSQGLLRETDILGSLTNLPEVADAPDLTQDELLEQQEDIAASDPSVATIKVGARSTDQEVTLIVDTISWQGTNLVLQVTMQNKSYHPTRFSYSPFGGLLVVNDDQGHTLRTFTDGLPTELPDDRELYKGSIQVSANEIPNARSINVSLTDYPERELQLNIKGIPIPLRPR
ncbi:MAG: hypothetical protein H7Y37_02410 [Anaerolineae bacterium]|nr:hypothetical protein [Gloeobacterales cyanobacterium ES-bin-313]